MCKSGSRNFTIAFRQYSAFVYFYEFFIFTIVDKVFDNEEIVIKPLSRYLNRYKAYSGMAILGSGEIAMILDVNGLSKLANLRFAETESNLNDLDLHEENK